MNELTTRISDLEFELINLQQLLRMVEEDFLPKTVKYSAKKSTFGTTYTVTGLDDMYGKPLTKEYFIED